MFNDKYGLTNAVIKGWKTQTRRIVPQKLIDYYNHKETKIYSGGITHYLIEKSRYKIGEVIAIAMCYGNCGTWVFPVAEYGNEKGYTNKMFVKAEYMPYQIKITNIRVEHLQDISDEDCIKEGIYSYDDVFGKCYMYTYPYDNNYRRRCFTTVKKAYSALIDKVSGKGTWESNPLVFVYDFELVK